MKIVVPFVNGLCPFLNVTSRNDVLRGSYRAGTRDVCMGGYSQRARVVLFALLKKPFCAVLSSV